MRNALGEGLHHNHSGDDERHTDHGRSVESLSMSGKEKSAETGLSSLLLKG